jgi:site-specific DNA recombinase
MSPVSARRNGRIHRYYVSQALLRGDRGVPGSLPRVPAEAVHALVDRELQAHIDLTKAGDDPRAALVKVVVADKAVELTLDPTMVANASEREPASDAPVILRIPALLKTFGGAQQMVDETGAPIQLTGPDRALQKAIARARRWARQIETGERTGADDIAAAEDLQSRYVDWILRLAWLAPDIIEAILSGKRLRDFTLTELITTDVPMDWRQQREMLVLVGGG